MTTCTVQVQHDMYLMGMMMASMEDPESTIKRKERRRIRNKYIYQVKHKYVTYGTHQICNNTFQLESGNLTLHFGILSPE
jgi:hypothetical protein